MKCPSCRKKAIDLKTWGGGPDCFKTICQSCGIPLKANIFLWIGAIITCSVTFVVAFYALDFLSIFGVEAKTPLFSIIVIIPVFSVGAMLTWWLAGYRVDKKRVKANPASLLRQRGKLK